MLILGFYLFFNKRKVAAFLIGFVTVFTVISYSAVNYAYNNYFGLSQLIEFNLVNHTGYYIEKGRHINPELVDIYVKYRDERMRTHAGKQEFTLGDCKDSICSTLNINYAEMLKQLSKVNNYLILHYPEKYIETCFYSLVNLINYSDDFYYYKITAPLRYLNLFNNFCFIIGLVLIFYKMKNKEYFTNAMLLIFITNLIFVIVLDSGDTYRHLLTIIFIPYIFFTEFSIAVIGKIKLKLAGK